VRVGLVAIPVSLWASWAAWRGPPPASSVEVPSPLPREVSEAARAQQRAVAATLTDRIQTAMREGPVPLSALYADNGEILQRPIPDNPLVPGVAHVVAHCGEGPSAVQADWWYCEETGLLRPGLAQ